MPQIYDFSDPAYIVDEVENIKLGYVSLQRMADTLKHDAENLDCVSAVMWRLNEQLERFHRDLMDAAQPIYAAKCEQAKAAKVAAARAAAK